MTTGTQTTYLVTRTGTTHIHRHSLHALCNQNIKGRLTSQPGPVLCERCVSIAERS